MALGCHFYHKMSGKRLSIEVRAEIAGLYPLKTIRQLAEMYSLSKSSVHNIVKKKKVYGTVADRPKSGRPKLSSIRDDRRLVRLSIQDRFRTAATLRNMWHIKASIATVKRRLLSAGLRGCVSKRKPPLTGLHKRTRLEWCRIRRNWTVEQWRSVVFVDESSFLMLPNSTRMHIRRRQNEKYSSACTSPSHKWRSPNLMVWGAISGAGIGPLHRCNGHINQFVYESILNEHEEYLIGCTMAQDNAPCHKTALIRDWMVIHGIQIIPWPSCSPDLNPIEQVWSSMKRSIQGRHFKSKDELWNVLSELWLHFTNSFVLRFIDSMPRRVAAVIAAKGGVTRY
jgi:transposase